MKHSPSGHRHRRPNRFAWRRWMVASAVLVLLGTLGWLWLQPPRWWQYTPSGQITQQPVFYRHSVIVVTNYGVVQSIDLRRGQPDWQYDRQAEIIAQPFIHQDQLLLAYKDGVIIALHPQTGQPRWQHSVPDGQLVHTPLITRQRLLYYGDSGGRVHAVALATGQPVWSYQTPQPERVSQVLTKDGLSWFGYLIIDRATVYAIRTHGHLTALHMETGQLRWQTALESSLVSDPIVERTQIVVSTTQSALIAIRRDTGQVRQPTATATTNTVLCQASYRPPGGWSRIAHRIDAEWPPLAIAIQEEQRLQRVVQVDREGQLISYRSNQLTPDWQLQLPIKPEKCFFDGGHLLYLADNAGQLLQVSLKKQAITWQRHFPGKVVTITASRKYLSPTGDPLAAEYYLDHVFVGDQQEHLFRLDPQTGQSLWQFKLDGTMYLSPSLTQQKLWVVSTNGGLYRLWAGSGRPDRWVAPWQRLSWRANTEQVEQGQIYELTVTRSGVSYQNPYTAVDLSATFRHQDGQEVKIPGFYYDQDQWRVRFNPPRRGNWQWKLDWQDSFQTLSLTGQFESQRDHSFLRRANPQSRWLTTDGQSIASITGLNDCLMDFNRDGSVLNDFAVETGNHRIATISGQVPQTLWFNDLPVAWSEYLHTYRAGFTLFRQNVSNCSPGLYAPERFIASQFSSQDGRTHDRISQELYRQGYSIWFTMFGFALPFGERISYPDELVATENYIKYVVARFGAYVDIWEVANEAVTSDEYVQTIARLIKKYDPFDRLITVSWDKPELAEMTLIAPHWYETEPDSSSDLATLAQLERFQSYNKPILFGEQGNQRSNWDPTSALRMRVRVWTAFFQQAGIVFWNQSSNQYYYNEVFDNSNQYIGPEERGMMEQFQRLTQQLPLDLESGPTPIRSQSVRSYTLSNPKLLLSYLFNPELRPLPISAVNPFGVPVTARWIAPETGAVLSELTVGPFQEFAGPSFRHDMLLRIDVRTSPP